MNQNDTEALGLVWIRLLYMIYYLEEQEDKNAIIIIQIADQVWFDNHFPLYTLNTWILSRLDSREIPTFSVTETPGK